MADNLWQTHPWLVGVLIVVNGLTAFSLTREFSLIFGGKPKQMTVRSPEGLWALVFTDDIYDGIRFARTAFTTSMELITRMGKILTSLLPLL